DGAGALRRRIGCEEVAVRTCRLRQVEVDQPRLDDRVAIALVDLKDAIHLGERDQDAAGYRDGTASKTSPRTTRSDMHSSCAGNLHDALNFGGGPRQHDNVGTMAPSECFVGTVVLVDGQLRRVRQHALAS